MPSNPPIQRAFILGAGLGLRLRPLTADLPKPLVPVKGRPLATHILDHLRQAGVREVIINTHHATARWTETFPQNEYQGMRLFFRHEPVLLDTGGGLKNVEDFLASHGTFLIYNGDVLASLPLEKAVEHHRQQKNLVTLVLRTKDGPRCVDLDAKGQVTGIHAPVDDPQKTSCLFTGIHVAEPAIFQHIPPSKPLPIIPIYRELIREGHRVGGVVLDEGEWSDLGTLAEYHRMEPKG